MEDKIFRRMWIPEKMGIDGTQELDLSRYAADAFGENLLLIHEAPEYMVEIGGTEYDVHLHFSGDGTQNVLQQFRKMIFKSA